MLIVFLFPPFTPNRPAMEWTQPHDVNLCREVIVVEPFKHKKGTTERGKAWSGISDTLNSSKELKLKVNQRSVRERFSLLQTRFKKKMRNEEAASGISPEISELDVLLEQITEKVAEEEIEGISNKKKAQLEKGKAEEMRNRAMEKMGETSKRMKVEEGSEVTKRRRRSGNETIEYLKEKAKVEKDLREKELELKKAEFEVQVKANSETHSQMQDMMQTMQQQQVQAQNMQTMLMQQQQQQNQVMMALLQYLANK